VTFRSTTQEVWRAGPFDCLRNSPRSYCPRLPLGQTNPQSESRQGHRGSSHCHRFVNRATPSLNFRVGPRSSRLSSQTAQSQPVIALTRRTPSFLDDAIVDARAFAKSCHRSRQTAPRRETISCRAQRIATEKGDERGLAPIDLRLEGRCSIQLSYGRVR